MLMMGEGGEDNNLRMKRNRHTLLNTHNWYRPKRCITLVSDNGKVFFFPRICDGIGEVSFGSLTFTRYIFNKLLVLLQCPNMARVIFE